MHSQLDHDTPLRYEGTSSAACIDAQKQMLARRRRTFRSLPTLLDSVLYCIVVWVSGLSNEREPVVQLAKFQSWSRYVAVRHYNHIYKRSPTYKRISLASGRHSIVFQLSRKILVSIQQTVSSSYSSSINCTTYFARASFLCKRTFPLQTELTAW